MAILIPKVEKSYSDDYAIMNLVNYCKDEEDGAIVGCYGITDIYHATEQIQLIANVYGKTDGRHMRHFMLSFDVEECVDYDLIFEIGGRVAAYYADRYQIVYAVHQKIENPHLHFVMSTVDYNTGLKFTGDYGEFHRFKQYVAQVLNEYGFTLYEK